MLREQVRRGPALRCSRPSQRDTWKLTQYCSLGAMRPCKSSRELGWLLRGHSLVSEAELELWCVHSEVGTRWTTHVCTKVSHSKCRHYVGQTKQQQGLRSVWRPLVFNPLLHGNPVIDLLHVQWDLATFWNRIFGKIHYSPLTEYSIRPALSQLVCLYTGLSYARKYLR